MSKNILVTGANGQLGREMQITAKASKGRYIFTDVAELDITNLSAIRQIVADNSVNVIINCAVYTNVDKTEYDAKTADLLNNIAVGHLASVARKFEATLIHISTDYVLTEQHTSHIQRSIRQLQSVFTENKVGWRKECRGIWLQLYHHLNLMAIFSMRQQFCQDNATFHR